MSRPAKRPRESSRTPRVAVKHRENTSTIVMYPYEVARQLLISEAEAYKQMALGPEHGGIRAMCIGDPNGIRPRKIVHRKDFELYVEFKRGLLTHESYLAALRMKASA